MPKKKPISYKKSAIIGGLIADALLIISILLILWSTQNQAQGIFYIMIPLLPAMLLSQIFDVYILFFISIIIYFILGALIGILIKWIINKLKTRKK